VTCIYGVRIAFVPFTPVPETGCPMWHCYQFVKGSPAGPGHGFCIQVAEISLPIDIASGKRTFGVLEFSRVRDMESIYKLPRNGTKDWSLRFVSHFGPGDEKG